MRGTLALVLGLAAFSMTACSSDDDDNNGNGSGSSSATDPSVSGVFPISGFTGRTVRVEISGDATKFADGATLDFGAGVTAKNVTVGSPTTLFADLDIDATAELGLRDVKVTSGSESLTLTKAFELKSPIELLASKAFQGGTTQIEIINDDLENRFDTTCGFSLFGTCYQYTGVDIQASNGLVAVSSVDETHIFATVYNDLDAATQTLTLTSGQLTSAPEGAITVTARTPTAAATGAVTLDDDGSALLSAPVAANTLTDISFPTGDDQNTSTVYTMPASGHWKDGVRAEGPDGAGTLHADQFSTTAITQVFVVVDDGYGEVTDMTLKTVTPGAAVTETEANNTAATAQTVSLPAYVTGGTITDDNDQDWFKFTVSAQNNGKTLRVFTFGDPKADVLVDGFKADGTTSLGESSDAGYQEDFVSTSTLVTGFSYVEVSASPYGIDATHNTYGAIIWAE